MSERIKENIKKRIDDIRDSYMWVTRLDEFGQPVNEHILIDTGDYYFLLECINTKEAALQSERERADAAEGRASYLGGERFKLLDIAEKQAEQISLLQQKIKELELNLKCSTEWNDAYEKEIGSLQSRLKSLKHLSVQEERPINALLEEAIDDLLKKYEPPAKKK